VGEKVGLDEGFLVGCLEGTALGTEVVAVTCTFSIKLEKSPLGARVRKVKSDL